MLDAIQLFHLYIFFSEPNETNNLKPKPNNV